METQENYNEYFDAEEWEKKHKRGKFFGGLLVVVAGCLYLAKELGSNIPDWVFSWKMLLIAIGAHIAVKNKLQTFGWIPFILVGGIFLVTQDLWPDCQIQSIVWPAAVILIGLFIMFKPHKKHRFGKDWRHCGNNKNCKTEDKSTEDRIHYDIVFGGVKKNIVSKKFEGGEIRAVFGGAELNFSQCDMVDKAEIQITQVFGGIKMIVPSNWKVQSEITTVMGGIDDKRKSESSIVDGDDKLLILKGNLVFGGIEIKS
jgi:predicted membrane protein